MKYFLWPAILLFVGCGTLYGQKSPVKYGDIPMSDMTMKIYDKDSSAVAVVLSDFGKAFVLVSSINATLNFERHVRIKILKKEGLKWADASIPIYHSGQAEEKVSSLKATTYNLVNGKIEETKMSKDGIFKEKFNRNINLQKFTLPNVREGSVIEYSYTVISEFLANYPNWQFQYSIPVRHSEYVASIPEFFVMERYMQGYVPVTTYEKKENARQDYNETTHQWVIDHVPAFKEEPYMTSEEDYVSKINFALAYINFRGEPTREVMGTWDKLVADLKKDDAFGKIVTGSSFLRKKTETLIAGETDATRKAKVIHDYVKSELEWNGTKDFLADDVKDIFERKKGTSGDINLVLGSMLTSAGFDVDMVLLSTRDHGFIREQYPMTKQFNYVVCRIWLGEKYLFLDATERFLPLDVLPERCLNGKGLLVSTKNTGWVNLTTKQKSRKVATATLTLDADGALNGTLELSHDGYEAQSVRRKVKESGHESFLKAIGQQKSWTISDSKLENVELIESSVKESHKVALPDHASTAGALTYIDPFITLNIGENPFRQQDRQFPVDFGTMIDRTYMLKLTIPEGYVVDEVPQSKVFMMVGNAAKFVYSVAQTGNVLSITNTFQVNKALFGIDEYANLREFYNQVIAKQAEQIVLKKN